MRRWGLVAAGALALSACRGGTADQASTNADDNRAASNFAERMTGTAQKPVPAAKPFKATDKTALQSETYVYSGGAHGMTAYDTLLWDKARKRETSVKGVMTSSEAFRTAIRDRFCAELDRQRAKKRGEPVKRGDDDFTKCIDPMEQVLALTSKDGKLIDSVTVVVGPYNAGPYAEGSYEVPVPVDAATYKAIKTEYQDGFVKP